MTWPPTTHTHVQDAVEALGYIDDITTGLYVSTFGVADNASTAATVSRLSCTPVILPALTLDRLAVGVQTGGAAGSVVRLGIYNDNGSGYPGSLLLDAGTVDATVAGSPEVTISQAVGAGLYWLAAVNQVAQATLRNVANARAWPLGTTAATTQAGGFYEASVTGALPANFTTTVNTAAAIRVYARVA